MSATRASTAALFDALTEARAGTATEQLLSPSLSEALAVDALSLDSDLANRSEFADSVRYTGDGRVRVGKLQRLRILRARCDSILRELASAADPNQDEGSF